MKCPECNHNKQKVLEIRTRVGHNYRRRECLNCKYRFSTKEIIYDPESENYRVYKTKKTKKKIKYETLYIDGKEVRRPIRK